MKETHFNTADAPALLSENQGVHCRCGFSRTTHPGVNTSAVGTVAL